MEHSLTLMGLLWLIPHTLPESLAQRDLKSDAEKQVGWLASLPLCY